MTPLGNNAANEEELEEGTASGAPLTGPGSNNAATGPSTIGSGGIAADPATGLSNPTSNNAETSTSAVSGTDGNLETKTYTANQATFGDAESVESRVAGIIDDDSPLMARARTKAKQAANEKGLLNSSMAVGASQAAVMDQATEIAMQDAKTAAEFNLSNVDAANKASEFDAEQTNRMALETYMQEKGGEIDLAKIAANIEGDSRLLNEKGEIDLSLMESEYDRKDELQNRQAEIDELLINAEGDVKSKLQQEQGEIDEMLAFVNGEIEADLQEKKGLIDLMLQDAAAEDAIILEKIKGEIDKQIANIQASAQIAAANIAASSRIQAAKIASESALEQIAAKGYVEFSLNVQEQGFNKETQELAFQNEKEMEGILTENKILINSSVSAQNTTATYTGNVTEILLNPDMNPEQKEAAIGVVTRNWEASLAFIDESTNNETNFADMIEVN